MTVALEEAEGMSGAQNELQVATTELQEADQAILSLQSEVQRLARPDSAASGLVSAVGARSTD